MSQSDDSDYIMQDESDDSEFQPDQEELQQYLYQYIRAMLRQRNMEIMQRDIEEPDFPDRENAKEEFEKNLNQKRHKLKSHDFKRLMDKECGKLDRPQNLAMQILNLDMQHKRDPRTKIQIFSNAIPQCQSEVIGQFDADLFCGQFSKDGELFVSACQDQVIRMYKSDDLEYQANVNRQKRTIQSPKPYKEIECQEVGWSVIDVAFSPDQKHLLYSSWTPNLHLVDVRDDTEPKQIALDLEPHTPNRFCPFSIRFSPDSSEVLAGASDAHIYIYDLEKNQKKASFRADTNDINAVEYASTNSNVFLSGGDSGVVHVWDTRQSPGTETAPKSQGCLIGHTLGICHLDSKKDGYFFISQSKDQSIKLFDLRKMKDQNQCPSIVSNTHWDYRRRACPTRYQMVVNPNDMSLMTYAGSHSVLQTLIRCYFSPKETTGQKFIYTGSSSGSCVIYDVLTGKKVIELVGHGSVTRDVSYHPFKPMLITSSWDAEMRMWRSVGDIGEMTQWMDDDDE